MRPRIPGVFVTATDTGIGKTLVAATIAYLLQRAGLRVRVMKPVQTGSAPGSPGRLTGDAAILERIARSGEPAELICPYAFREPLAPLAASRIENRKIEFPVILKAFRALGQRADFIVVEGVGGLAVPITERLFAADLARRMGLPLVVVTRPGLGTLNHTWLTVHLARSRGIPICGLIINHAVQQPLDLATKTNPALLERLCGTPILGDIPHLKGFRRTGSLERSIDRAARYIRIRRLMPD